MHQEAVANRGCSNARVMDDQSGADWDWNFNLTRLTAGSSSSWTHDTARASAQNWGQWFHDVMGLREEPNGVRRMWPTATFVVSSSRIRSRPRAFYESLREQYMVSNPIECHYLERSWFYVFNCDRV